MNDIVKVILINLVFFVALAVAVWLWWSEEKHTRR